MDKTYKKSNLEIALPRDVANAINEIDIKEEIQDTLNPIDNYGGIEMESPVSYIEKFNREVDASISGSYMTK